jgi:hypothetical protein
MPRRLPVAVLLVCLGLWGTWFISRSSFEVEGRRYFTLFDDAMISMSYARNLVEGHGLNWARQGEPVEGFTHPLWLLVMIPVNALPVPLRDRSLIIEALSLFLLAATVLAVRRLTIDHFSEEGERHWAPAAVLTAFYYPLDYWSLRGMETALQALLVVLAVHLALDIVHQGRDRHLALWGLCAAAWLLRMDMLLAVGVIQLYVLLGRGVRTGRRSWWLGLGLFGATLLGYSAFRWIYFHDLLPNTYYLKLTGVPLLVRLLRGISFLAEFVHAHLAILVPVGVGIAPLLRRRPRLLLPAALFLTYAAYSVWVGGDVWEHIGVRANRFLTFVMPLVFVLLAALVNAALAAAARWRHGEAPLLERYVVTGVTTVALLLANGLWLAAGAAASWRLVTVTDRPPLVDAEEQVLTRLLRFQQITDPGAVVATAWAGIPCYFSSYRMIDILGYNDRQVARMASVLPLGPDNFQDFVPGHVKFDLRRLLEEQRPDAFFQIWDIHLWGKPVEVLPRFGYHRDGPFWVREDSPYVHRPGPRLERRAESPRHRRAQRRA